MASREDAVRVVSALPEVTQGLRHGNATWFVGGTPFVWERPFSKADVKRFGDAVPPEGPILAVRVEDLLEKEAVLNDASDAVFTVPHFDGYAAILIQLSRVEPEELSELITGAWVACAPADLVASFLGDAG